MSKAYELYKKLAVNVFNRHGVGSRDYSDFTSLYRIAKESEQKDIELEQAKKRIKALEKDLEIEIATAYRLARRLSTFNSNLPSDIQIKQRLEVEQHFRKGWKQ